MNKAHPAISVVMSVFNGEAYLEEAICSVLDQSMQDFELIVIDDGSTDSTGKILECFEDPRLKTLKQANQGLTRSLNTGIAMAKGEYIARMDADDLSHPERLLRQYEEMQRRPDLALLGTWSILIGETGKELEKKKLPVGIDEIKSSIFLTNPFVHGSMMFRKQALNSVSGYRDAFIYAQDYDLALRINEQYEIDNLPEYLYLSRHNLEMISVQQYGKQHAFAELARTLRAERDKQGNDALDRGAYVGDLLQDDRQYEDGVVEYYRNIISAKSRQGKTHEARSAVASLLKLTPFTPKLWAIGLATFFGSKGMRMITRVWDGR